MKKEIAELSNTVIVSVGIFAALLTVVSVFLPDSWWLTLTAAVITLAATIAQPRISSILAAYEEGEKEELRAQVRALEPFTWPAARIEGFVALLRDRPSDVRVIEQAHADGSAATIQISAAFRDAGWTVVPGKQLGPANRQWISVAGDSEAANRVRAALTAVGMDFDETLHVEPPLSVTVVIGDPVNH